MPESRQEPAQNSGPMISVCDLRVKYGELEILHGITFDVKRGETLVILGGSGSGKSICCAPLLAWKSPARARSG